MRLVKAVTVWPGEAECSGVGPGEVRQSRLGLVSRGGVGSIKVRMARQSRWCEDWLGQAGQETVRQSCCVQARHRKVWRG